MKTVLATLPRHDIGTEYLYAWSKRILETATDRGWKVQLSEGEKANRKEIHSRLSKLLESGSKFCFFNGHGSESEIAGHELEVVMDEASVKLLAGAITFARACNCVRKLGKAAVSSGCLAFTGYSSQFWIPRIDKYESTPLRDEAAKPVMEVSNAVALEIIKGSTAARAVEASHEAAGREILKLLVSEEPYARASLKAIVQNDGCLELQGNAGAKIE